MRSFLSKTITYRVGRLLKNLAFSMVDDENWCYISNDGEYLIVLNHNGIDISKRIKKGSKSFIIIHSALTFERFKKIIADEF